MSVSWCLWTGWRVVASRADRWGGRDPTEEWGGAQVDPEGRAPGILQLGVRPWGLPVCLASLSALPVHGPSARGWERVLVQQPLAAWLGLGGAPGDSEAHLRSERGCWGQRASVEQRDTWGS